MKLWIRLDAGTPRDPKIDQLAQALGVRRAEAFGLAASVWCVMAEHAVDGDLREISNECLEIWSGWQGRAGRFAPEFRKVFCNNDGAVGGWSERQGKLLERMERDRARHRKDADDAPNPPRKPRGNSAEIPGNLLGNSTSTERNGTVQKEEPLSSTKRSTRKAPPEKHPDKIPAVVYDHLIRVWTKHCGAIDIGRFRRMTRIALLAGIRAGQIERAIPEYAKAMRERHRALKLEWFCEDVQTWIKEADVATTELMPHDAFGLTADQAAAKTRAHYAKLEAQDEELVRRLTIEVVA